MYVLALAPELQTANFTAIKHYYRLRFMGGTFQS